MYEDTPNKEYIDSFSEKLKEIYNYEDLKDCDIDYLYNLEYGIMNRFTIFKSTFPPEGGIEGPRRAMLLENPNADRVALTQAEKVRLDLLGEELEKEIRRAKGHRMNIRRNHRSDLVNSLSDAVKGLGEAVGTIKPW